MNKSYSTQKGIGLVEVMIAIVIVAVGILGISKLQLNVVRSAVDANNRGVAAVIAQNKIDDLRSYARLTTPVAGDPTLNNLNRHSYQEITTNVGGEFAANSTTVRRLPSGVVNAAALNLPTNTQFTLGWTLVGNYYYNADLTPATTTNTSGAAVPDFKIVEVTVSWNDVNGPQQHRLRTIIDGYSPLFTSQFGTANYGSVAPIVPYTPELAPEVVPVTLDIGDKKRESSKPVPEVSKKGFSTAVTFETVTYDNLINSVADTVRREEFVTAKCRCGNLASSDNSIQIKGKTIWNDTLMQLEDTTELISLATPIVLTDVDDGGGEAQAPQCSIVCRQATDPASGVFKVARLKRINGVLRLYNDWQLVAFNIVPASYFNTGTGETLTANSRNSLVAMDNTTQTENIARYSDYTISVVRNVLAQINGGNPLPAVDTGFSAFSDVNNFDNDPTITSGTLNHLRFIQGAANNRQLQARALYMDIPPAGAYSNSEGADFDANNIPLDRVPFYENNFTQLVGWIPDVLVGANGVNTGDINFTTPANYPTRHDEIRDCVSDPAPYNGIARIVSGRSYPTTRNFVTNQQLTYGNSFTECPNASRGLFYPITNNSAAPQNYPFVPSVTNAALIDISARIFNGNNGIVDEVVNSNEPVSTDTTTLIVRN